MTDSPTQIFSRQLSEGEVLKFGNAMKSPKGLKLSFADGSEFRVNLMFGQQFQFKNGSRVAPTIDIYEDAFQDLVGIPERGE